MGACRCTARRTLRGTVLADAHCRRRCRPNQGAAEQAYRAAAQAGATALLACRQLYDIRPLCRPAASVRRFEPHEYPFGCGCVADVGDAVQRNEHVGFGVVGRRRPPSGGIRDHTEIRRVPLATVLPSTHQVDQLMVRQSELFEVGRVDQHDPSCILDAAISVVRRVRHGVPLVMRPHGLQHEMPCRHADPVEGVGSEQRLARRCVEPVLVDRIGKPKPARLAHPIVEVLEVGHYPGYRVADHVVVGLKVLPRNRGRVAERPAREPADDRHLAQQMLRCRGESAVRLVHDAHRVFHRDKLFTGRLDITVTVGRISAVSPHTACERLSFVEMWAVSRQFRIARSVNSLSGVARTKLPAKPTNNFARPSRMARMESTASRPCFGGGVKPNSRSSASRNDCGIFSQMPIVRSPWTLLCPRTGHTPVPGRPRFPRSIRKFTISRTVATPYLCWVTPIAQHTMIFLLDSTRSTTCSISSRESPVASRTSAHEICRTWLVKAPKPVVWVSMNSWSSTLPGAASSAFSRSALIAWNSARSPQGLMCRN